MIFWQKWRYLGNHWSDHHVSNIKQNWLMSAKHNKKNACQYLYMYRNGKTLKTYHQKKTVSVQICWNGWFSANMGMLQKLNEIYIIRDVNIKPMLFHRMINRSWKFQGCGSIDTSMVKDLDVPVLSVTVGIYLFPQSEL